ncbi:uncharacterized protein RCC_10956 [Ramularia collo-cygni]|uniref:Uncharacterized protein n=1 Tax=Ramularia collo-cygni TaxID=112498 RepID=A0A2D3V4K6_9PEZI|nr:uncharacterized protein RCC_10956 [Ramularia collo-cygni]CZT25227.1 uncharacterized protein RCC_10956 [Ramularia collo-cygni]
MSSYGLRQSPKPSKRSVEAGEKPLRGAKVERKRKRKVEIPDEEEALKAVSRGVESKGLAKENNTTTNNKSKDNLPRIVQAETARPEKRRKIKAKQSDEAPKALTVRRSKRTQKPQKQPDNTTIPDNNTSTSIIKPPQKLSTSNPKIQHSLIQSPRPPHKQPPPPNPPPRPTQKNPPIKPINLPSLRSLATIRGPQITPNGLGIDLSPSTLPSPETPPSSSDTLPPDPYDFPTKTHVARLEKKKARGLVVRNYSPFDIVSGGKPPEISEREEKFWDEQPQHVEPWIHEELPDQYGRLWRCVKMVGEEIFGGFWVG